MPPVNPGLLAQLGSKFSELGLPYAFVGGSVLEYLLDKPILSDIRPTDDVDVVIEVMAAHNYANVEARLREAQFQHDMTPGAPMCRWIYKGITVDVMPTEGARLNLNTLWFREAVTLANTYTVQPGVHFSVISPVVFLATKFAAFTDRGNDDFYASHDLEDAMVVIDGRAEIIREIGEAPTEIRSYIAKKIAGLMANEDFRYALPGYLPSDAGSQARIGTLLNKLSQIATCAQIEYPPEKD
jgi:hypothetical protein